METIYDFIDEEQKGERQNRLKGLAKVIKDPSRVWFNRENINETTTMRLKGGTAEAVVRPGSLEELQSVMQYINEIRREGISVPVWRQSGGSKIVYDNHVPGVIILVDSLNKYAIEGNIVEAECGVSVDNLIRAAIRNNLTGFEFYIGAPAKVGGIIAHNFSIVSGNEGVIKTQDLVDKVIAVDNYGNQQSLDREKVGFDYKSSAFLSGQLTNNMVYKAVFRLGKDKKSNILRLRNQFFKERYYVREQPRYNPKGQGMFGAAFKKGAYIEDRTATSLIKEVLQRKELEILMKEKPVYPHLPYPNVIINKGEGTIEDLKGIVYYMWDRVKKIYGIDLKAEFNIFPTSDIGGWEKYAKEKGLLSK